MSEESQQNSTKPKHEVFTISFSSTSLPPDPVDVNIEPEQSSDFEAAVEATGYGLFNYLILLAILPGICANVFDTTTISYLLPSAECDLQLTLNQKGMLNAVIYTGMLCSGFFWGFLADTKGRRSLLIFGYLADAICNILSSMSQNFYMMLCLKFLCGVVISGPLAITMTYLAEFHSTKYRSATLYWTAVFSAAGNVILPALAWLIIPQNWSVTLFNGTFVYNSWRIFVLVCSLPALTAFLGLLHFPESPKYLMSQGKNERALKIFQKMYAMNTGNPPEMFPIKSLSQDGNKKQVDPSRVKPEVSFWKKTREGWNQVKPLFVKPYLGQFLLITILQFGSILSLNTIRLWMPQLFTLIETYDFESHDPSRGAVTLCDMISVRSVANVTLVTGLNTTMTETCVIPPVPVKVYTNSMIISSSTVLGFLLAGTVVNLIGKKNLLLATFAIPAACTIALNWSPDSTTTLGILAIYITLTSISTTTIVTYMVDLMPTSLRTIAVSLAMSIGRSGPMIGNVLFPILLSASCIGPFVFVGAFLISGFILTLFIPTPPTKLL
ncbi:synaptic vesicle glycoprotein 2B-like [Athalia rosae]|uniref:synaptic vesicle glycoprotein 2B-like n=1 Tax=Athalia rosae TaxID=37344 RepID=UPI002033F67F|nr:synaptic vesicle glycoprotein 2B-like [Athalia rosae]XP_012260532.2 synaptic vesicle glycoprotein 2B-like [Athalia rosae]XP_012260533.2 synaptic vesicle glycoprotein 2B-like [Athalia rosae]XP_012260535.2 synaptic vesicle glycoprotein 2B-like [Athalia rosae]XP_048512485.1 synaptic vesicle glycoprotein 2B-like [Athalia rosae]